MATVEQFAGRLMAVSTAPEPSYRVPPHNIEAEQALLGAILVNNDAYDRVSDFLRASISSRKSTAAFSRSPGP